MKIEQGKRYRIKGRSEYFKDKYGTSNPEIFIEGTDIQLWGRKWELVAETGNMSAALYFLRQIKERLPEWGIVWGGKVKQKENVFLSELVHESELEGV